MSLRSRESRANARAFLAGMVVPTLLITLFLASARATFAPAPASPDSKPPAPSRKAAAEPSTLEPPKAGPMLVVAANHGACAAGSSYGYSGDADRDFFWALVEGRANGKRHTVGSMDERAQRAISRALRRDGGKLLYFRLDNRDYIVRDPETIAEASEIVEPMEALGRRMGELGGRQGALGGRQGALGGKQGMLGARQAELAMRQASLAMEIRSRERRGLSTAGLERERRQIDEEMRECSERQSELGRRQSELGAQQSKLGAEQSRYGEEMRRVSAEVERELRKLARKSIESGEARTPRDSDA